MRSQPDMSRFPDMLGYHHVHGNRPHLQWRPDVREFSDVRGNINLRAYRDLRSSGDLQWFRYVQLVGDVR